MFDVSTRKVSINENGKYVEEFDCDHPVVSKVSFVHNGTEASLDNFLKTIIVDKAAKNGLLTRP